MQKLCVFCFRRKRQDDSKHIARKNCVLFCFRRKRQDDRKHTTQLQKKAKEKTKKPEQLKVQNIKNQKAQWYGKTENHT